MSAGALEMQVLGVGLWTSRYPAVEAWLEKLRAAFLLPASPANHLTRVLRARVGDFPIHKVPSWYCPFEYKWEQCEWH